MYNELFRKYFKFCGIVVFIMGVVVLMLGMTANMVNYGKNLQYLIYLGVPFIIIGIVIIVITGMLKPGYVTRAEKNKRKIAKNAQKKNNGK